MRAHLPGDLGVTGEVRMIRIIYRYWPDIPGIGHILVCQPIPDLIFTPRRSKPLSPPTLTQTPVPALFAFVGGKNGHVTMSLTMLLTMSVTVSLTAGHSDGVVHGKNSAQ